MNNNNNNNVILQSDVKTNGFHENDKNEDDVPVENITKDSKTGEDDDDTSKTHDSSDQVDKKVSFLPNIQVD